MTGSRRTVRITRDFFDQLDRQLPAERGPDGRPSRSDFEVYDLLEIVEVFATRFGELPQMFPGRPEYRVLIAPGRLVPMVSVDGQLASDGAVELIRIRIDTDAPW